MSHLVRRHGRRTLNLADLTPLVDVALVLVVFLLLTAQVAEADAMPVDLPLAESADARSREGVEITVLADGAVVVDGATVNLDRLGALVADAGMAIVRADRGCRHGRVVAVIDAIRRAGVTRVYYATEREQGIEDW